MFFGGGLQASRPNASYHQNAWHMCVCVCLQTCVNATCASKQKTCKRQTRATRPWGRFRILTPAQPPCFPCLPTAANGAGGDSGFSGSTPLFRSPTDERASEKGRTYMPQARGGDSDFSRRLNPPFSVCHWARMKRGVCAKQMHARACKRTDAN